MNVETLAQLFHETYERLAPSFGYTTKPETAIPWRDIPADNANKRLMIAVAVEVLAELRNITEEYIDDETGILIEVTRDIPEHPRITAYLPTKQDYAPEAGEAALHRLLAMAKLLPGGVVAEQSDVSQAVEGGKA